MANLYNVPLKNAVQKVLANTLLTSETGTITFTTSVTSDLQASASIPGILVVDRIDVNGTLTPTLTEYISFTGVSGSTVTGLARGLGGTSAQDHSIGAIVEFVPDVVWADSINDVFTEQHNPDGTHKTLSNISLASITIKDVLGYNVSLASGGINNYLINNVSLASSTIFNSKFDGGLIVGASIASTTLTNRTYIQSRSISRGLISLASSTYNISVQNANMFDLYLNGTSKSLAVNDVFADSSMTSPFVIKVFFGASACSLTFQNTINWAGGTAPTQTGVANKADFFGFIPSTASVFDGFVVGLNHSV
jgi:hypothetical protein